MAMILVSHDLGAVAGRTHRVQVMYAGRTVESGRTRAVFTTPEHPYSEALLASIPRLDDAPHTVLRAIEGMPPDMTRPPAGCRFAPRCGRRQDVCLEETPLLRPVTNPDHTVACHFPVTTPAPVPTPEVPDGR